jgi:transcriptional regulator with XRE-family HTH domain
MSHKMPDTVVGRLIVGENAIRAWREHRGLSMQEMGDKSYLQERRLAELERGKAGNLHELWLVAEALGVDVDDLGAVKSCCPESVDESLLLFEHNDGGRAAAGFKGTCGDCVVRAIAIATEQPYREVYNALRDRMRKRVMEGEDRTFTARPGFGARNPSPRDGVSHAAFTPYLKSLGWEWVHLPRHDHRVAVYPKEPRMIVEIHHHMFAMIDGVVHDLGDSRRSRKAITSRTDPALRAKEIFRPCPVYGYWRKSAR